MDIFAHGLWTNAVYEVARGRRKRSSQDIATAIFFGIAPDLFSFGFYVFQSLFGSSVLWPYAQARFHSEWLEGAGGLLLSLMSDNLRSPDPTMIPQYVHSLYNITHSFVIFLIVFLIIWAVRRSPYWLFGAWGLHIFVDIFSHSSKFFPTPIFFPFSSFYVSGMSWADPVFFIINYSLIIMVYVWLYKFRRDPSQDTKPV